MYRDTTQLMWDEALKQSYEFLYAQYQADSTRMFKRPLNSLLTYRGEKVTDRGDTVGAAFYLRTRTFDFWAKYAPIVRWTEDTTQTISPAKGWWENIKENIVLVVLSMLFGMLVMVVLRIIAKV